MFYGWWIVIGVFLAQMVMTGFYTYSFPLFVLPLEEEFSASRTEIMMGMSGAGLIGVVLPLLIGPLVDRWSVRGLMTIGAVVFGAGLYFLSTANGVIAFSIIFAIVIALASALLGPMTGSTVVSRWFERRRGFALGVAAIGTSVGGLIMPILMADSIEAYGWRETLRFLYLFILAILLPYLVLVIRDHPADKGETIDGVPAAESSAASQAMQLSSWKEIVQQRNFWFLSISLGLFFASYSSLMANLTAYAGGLGVDLAAAAKLISVVAVLGFIGKLVFGALADRLSPKILLGASMTFTAVAMSILATEPSYELMLLATFLMGLSAGGMLPVWGTIVPLLFGLANYGRVMGFMMPVIALLAMPGFVVLAQIYDRTGSYQIGLWLFVGLVLLAMLLLSLVRMPASPKTDH